MAVKYNDSTCADLMNMAERELGAFISAVTESYGADEASISGEDWLDELESMQGLPGFTTREWRQITIKAAARLASRLVKVGHYATQETK